MKDTHGWLSKLWSRFGYPRYLVPYYSNVDPERDNNFDNHPHCKTPGSVVPMQRTQSTRPSVWGCGLALYGLGSVGFSGCWNQGVGCGVYWVAVKELIAVEELKLSYHHTGIS